MLILKNIIKEYKSKDTTIKVLNGVNIEFKDNELVSILGLSGCGKTTLLNIIGGLDRYTSGSLSINGKSTMEFSSQDWDTYRNNSIGFVFQSYNLIQHLTVLANVELALALSHVSKSERQEKAVAVLTKVGLDDQLHKKPKEISCGQMQRVAIARALVKNPDILLVDEPTSALDLETSVQIMEILKEIAKDKLVIMVTNNCELAMQYCTRIIKLQSGNVIDDSNPYHVVVEKPSKSENGKNKKIKKNSMSFFTSLSFSVNNLMAKKTRTFMTAFAGSIGIIGIALVWTLSRGVQTYISIAFAVIFLVVSPILIGIITYISVLERTKEIGILRSIGASKTDIYRIFNGETLIVGFVTGAIGVGVTMLLTIPINMVNKSTTGISSIVALPVAEGGVIVLISMALNLIAGWIPSRIAAKKDLIVALRNE